MKNSSCAGGHQRRNFSTHRIFWGVVLIVVCLFAPSMVIAGKVKTGGTLRFGTENEFAGFEVLKFNSRLAINGSIAANTIMEPLFSIG